MRRRTSLGALARELGVPERLVRAVARGERVGSAASVALAMGVHAQTVRRWKRSGVPESRLAPLVSLVADREAIARAEAVERRRVEKLVRRARREGLIPKTPTRGTIRFGGRRAVGLKTVYHLNQHLAPETLETIRGLTMSAPRGKWYIVTVSATEAGVTGKVRGYRGKLTQKLGKKAQNIAFSTAITSGAHKSRGMALGSLFSKLQGAISDTDSLIYLTDLLIFSYDYMPGVR